MSASAWIRGAVVAAMLLGGCVTDEIREAQIYVVRPRDTLYSIAWRHNLDYRDLAQWNHIGPDFRIAIGQRLVLGPEGRRAAEAAQSSATSSAAAAHGLREQPGTGRPAVPAPTMAGAAALPIPHLNWVWPTDRDQHSRPVQSRGISIPGQLGQQIRAAAAGRVVYTGSGIRGYGQLVIIKHNDVLLSAYAYNRDVTVSEGQEVAAGQAIAHMGEGAHQAPLLYFEIRFNGKPIDPLPFLNGKK